jgi:hypothetical protein
MVSLSIIGMPGWINPFRVAVRRPGTLFVARRRSAGAFFVGTPAVGRPPVWLLMQRTLLDLDVPLLHHAQSQDHQENTLNKIQGLKFCHTSGGVWNRLWNSSPPSDPVLSRCRSSSRAWTRLIPFRTAMHAWRLHHCGPLDSVHTMHLVIPSATVTALEWQSMLARFFLRMLRRHRR